MNHKARILRLLLFLCSFNAFAQESPLVFNTSDNITLPGGNYIVKDSNYDEGALTDIGIVKLYNGTTNELISTLKGARTGDRLGNNGIAVLSNGNFIIRTTTGIISKIEDYFTWTKNDINYNRILSNTNSIYFENNYVIGFYELSNGNIVFTHGAFLDKCISWFNATPNEINNSNLKTYCQTTAFDCCPEIIKLPNGNFMIWFYAFEAGIIEYSWHDGTIGSNLVYSGRLTFHNFVEDGRFIEGFRIIDNNLYSLSFVTKDFYTPESVAQPPIVDIIASTNSLQWGREPFLKVEPSGPNPIEINQYNAKVWLNEQSAISENGKYFVTRHFEISPISTQPNISAKIKLYFRQEEFDNYNSIASNQLKLPTGPTDTMGKSNLLIRKYSGSANTAYGLPSSYTGALLEINPNDSDIIWNGTMWEVGFETVGFSGFFLTTDTSLPANLLSFIGKNSNQGNSLSWETDHETNVAKFEVERSTDAKKFTKIGAIAANNKEEKNNYQFIDENIGNSNLLYYRLKVIEADGLYDYSKIIAIVSERKSKVTISPNPTNNELYIDLGQNKNLVNTNAYLYNSKGSIVKSVRLKSQVEKLNIGNLPKSIYYLKFIDGTTVKVIKE